MRRVDRLKNFVEKINNFGRNIKCAAERLEDKILAGKAKYILEPIPFIGDYIWNRATGEEKDISIGGAICGGTVRGTLYALAIYTGNLSPAVIPAFIDALKETSTILEYRKPKPIEITERSYFASDGSRAKI